MSDPRFLPPEEYRQWYHMAVNNRSVTRAQFRFWYSIARSFHPHYGRSTPPTAPMFMLADLCLSRRMVHQQEAERGVLGTYCTASLRMYLKTTSGIVVASSMNP